MFSKEENQYIADAMDSHVKALGLRAGTMWMVILAKLQAAANETVDETAPGEPSGDAVES